MNIQNVTKPQFCFHILGRVVSLYLSVHMFLHAL